jgi:hypothetical protein
VENRVADVGHCAKSESAMSLSKKCSASANAHRLIRTRRNGLLSPITGLKTPTGLALARLAASGGDIARVPIALRRSMFIYSDSVVRLGSL